jgi:hypothetical protein
MGAHTSYPLLIFNLISLKSQFFLITDVKFQEVIKELLQHEIYPDSENEHLPDHLKLAERLKYKQSKMSKILKGLFNKVIENLYDHPITIKNIVHILHIYPYIELGDKKENEEWVKQQWRNAISISAILPYTPKIGEQIEIPFLTKIHGFDTEAMFNSGYVHDIRHTIKGTIQEILVFIYPFKNFYYKWEEMKKEYEDHKRWMARIEAESKW